MAEAVDWIYTIFWVGVLVWLIYSVYDNEFRK
nr:MAG TPA: hypothetical protein [Caudoviricetes sp.]